MHIHQLISISRALGGRALGLADSRPFCLLLPSRELLLLRPSNCCWGERKKKKERKPEKAKQKEDTLRTKRQSPSGQEGRKHHCLESDTGPGRLQWDPRSVSTGCGPSLVTHLALGSLRVTETCASVSPSGTRLFLSSILSLWGSLGVCKLQAHQWPSPPAPFLCWIGPLLG